MMVKMVCILLLIFGVWMYRFIDLSFAAEGASANMDLEKIVVTPLRSSESPAETSRDVTIIKTDTLKTENNNLGKALDYLPATYIVDYGQLGAEKKIEIRGSSPEQVLVMQDGRPLNNPRNGRIDLSTIPLDNIERIEIVKGPASSLYGSSAVGGVVNLITKSAGKKPRFEITSRYGTFHTFENQLIHSARFKTLEHFLTYSNLKSEGHRDNSDTEMNNTAYKITFSPSPNNKIIFQAGYHDSDKGLPGSIASPDTDDRLEEFKNYEDLTYNGILFGSTEFILKAYSDYDRLEAYGDGASSEISVHTTKKRAIDFQLTQPIKEMTKLIVGVNGVENKNNSSKSGKHRYNVRAVFFEDILDIFEPLELVVGTRYDDYSNFGGEINPSASFVYKPTESLKFRGMVARSFRVPTFNNLYWPSTTSAEGNPNLKPEKAISHDVGIDTYFFEDNLKASLTYFRTDSDDLINWAAGDDGIYRPYNVGRAVLKGLEFFTDLKLAKNFSTDFSYTFLMAKDDKIDKFLPYKPKHIAAWRFYFDLPKKYGIKVEERYTGRRFSDTKNNFYLKQYFLTNCEFQKNFSGKFKGFVRIDNLFNRKYQKVRNYPMPGFSITAGVDVEF